MTKSKNCLAAEKGEELLPVSAVQPTMLWESTNAEAALQQRFRFAAAAQTVAWLQMTLPATYAITVQSVDRLVISAANLLAWLTTPDGPLLVKCCAEPAAHVRLAQIAELLIWLAQQRLPVSAPLPTRSGALQVRCDHLTVGLQRLLPGQALDPTDLGQAYSAGVILARLHHLLALYPRASALSTQTPLPALADRILASAETYAAQSTAPALLADCRALIQRLTTTALPPLTSQLVHNDYRAANLLWHEGTLRAVLDFEEVRPGYRVNELAWATVHLGTRFHNWGPVAPTVHATFCAGYASILPLSAAEQEWLPLLLRWHGLTLAAAGAQ